LINACDDDDDEIVAVADEEDEDEVEQGFDGWFGKGKNPKMTEFENSSAALRGQLQLNFSSSFRLRFRD